MSKIGSVALSVTIREQVGKGAARATRRMGLVPCVIYGAKQDPIAVAINPKSLWSELRKPGFTTRLFDLETGKGQAIQCLARDVQWHPVTDQPLHVDFMRVSRDALLHVKVPIHTINADKSPGIKAGGVLNIEHHEIEVTCKPESIPSAFTIDLAGLDIGSAVHVADLNLSDEVKAYHLTEASTILTIAPPTVSREPVATTETTAAAAAPAPATKA